MSKWNRQTHGEKTVSVDPGLSSRGINKFHLEGHFIWRVTSKLSKNDQCLSKLSRSFASYESSMPYESNLNSISDMKNSEATKQPMLPDTSTCVADHNDELSKDSVIDYVRKLMRNPYQTPAIEEGLRPFANTNVWKYWSSKGIWKANISQG